MSSSLKDRESSESEEQKENQNKGNKMSKEKDSSSEEQPLSKESNQKLSSGNIDADDIKFSIKIEESEVRQSGVFHGQTSNISESAQNLLHNGRPSGREMFRIQNKYREDENIVIYKDEFKDKLMLSPIKKYAKYNKFPFKMMIHIALIIFTSLQIEYTHSEFTPFSREQDYQWLSLFYNDEQAASNNGIYTFYDMDDFQDHLENLFKNVREFNNRYFQQINVKHLDVFLEYAPEPITRKDLFVNFENYPIDIYLGITKPFDQHDKASIKKFLGQTRAFSININNLSVTLAHENQPYSCWNFAIQYQFISTIFLQSVLQADGKMCDDYAKVTNKISEATILFKGSQVIINIIILTLAFSSFILGVKYIFDMIKDYMYFKKKGQILVPTVNKPKRKQVNDMDEGYLPENLIQILHEQRPWQELSFDEKLKYFDMWFIIILMGNICQISSCLFIMLQDKHDNLVSRLSEPFRWLQGLGCSLAWLTALKYFDYFSNFNITSEIMRYSFPKIGKHFIGYIPVLASFVIVGMTVFGGSQRFATLRDCFATLFSLLLGDSINDITHDIEDNGVSKPIAIIYIVGFIILFILAVNNIMIAIIQDEGSRRKEVVQRDNEYKKLEKFKKKLAKAKKIEEQKLKQRLQSGENLEDITQNVRQQSQQSDYKSRSASKFPPKQFDTDDNNCATTPLSPQGNKDLLINRSHQDSLSSSQSVRERKEGTGVVSSDMNLGSLQFQPQQTSIIQSSNNLLAPVYEDLRESLQKDDDEQQYQQTSQKTEAERIFESVQKQNQLDTESQRGTFDKNEGESIANLLQQQSSISSQAPQRKSQSYIDKSQKTKISLKALTKVAIQMRKSKQNAQEKIDLRDQFSKEVEILTEQKVNYKEIYKTFKNGFYNLTDIVDKQSFEIKDSLYLYHMTQDDRSEIRNKFCDILTYFTYQTRTQIIK